MSIMNYEYVLASGVGRGIFNFYPTMTAARDDMERANREFNRLSDAPYEPMTYTDYKRRERTFWLGDPPTQITAEQWDDMLNVLPPMRWTQEPDFNSFLMSEMMTGTFTNQYVRYGHGDACTYWSKMVDCTDPSTWLKRGECPVKPSCTDCGLDRGTAYQAVVELGLWDAGCCDVSAQLAK